MAIQWSLVIFTLLVSLSAGVLATLGTVALRGVGSKLQKPGSLIVLISVAVGGFSSSLHLGHPERVFGGFSNLHSGITQELIAFVVVGVVMLAYCVLVYRKTTPGRWISVLAIVGSVYMVVAFADSYLMPARPVWNTIMLPLTYLASSAVLGLLTTWLLAAIQKEDAGLLVGLKKASRIALIVQTVVLLGYLVHIEVAPFPDSSRSLGRLLMGDLSPVFWFLVVAIGLLAPYRILTTRSRVADDRLVPLASVCVVCVLVGGVAFRAVLFVMGTTVFNRF